MGFIQLPAMEHEENEKKVSQSYGKLNPKYSTCVGLAVYEL